MALNFELLRGLTGIVVVRLLLLQCQLYMVESKQGRNLYSLPNCTIMFLISTKILLFVLHTTNVLFFLDNRNKVQAVVGETAILPCELTPAMKSDSAHLVLWYKELFGTPIYRFALCSLNLNGV